LKPNTNNTRCKRKGEKNEKQPERAEGEKQKRRVKRLPLKNVSYGEDMTGQAEGKVAGWLTISLILLKQRCSCDRTKLPETQLTCQHLG